MCASAAGRLGFLMVCCSRVRRLPRRDVHGLCQHVVPAWEKGAGRHMGSCSGAVHSTYMHTLILAYPGPAWCTLQDAHTSFMRLNWYPATPADESGLGLNEHTGAFVWCGRAGTLGTLGLRLCQQPLRALESGHVSSVSRGMELVMQFGGAAHLLTHARTSPAPHAPVPRTCRRRLPHHPDSG